MLLGHILGLDSIAELGLAVSLLIVHLWIDLEHLQVLLLNLDFVTTLFIESAVVVHVELVSLLAGKCVLLD